MTINCKGTLVDLTTPKIMGILNITPDSFYDGGKYQNEKSILIQVEKMLNEGTTFIDVGAYSSRPGAKHVSEEDELKRIVPIVELILKNFSEIYLSIDTFRSKIAEECINSGAAIINDISAGKLDKNMIPTIGKLSVPYIMMHMKGNPQTMQSQTQYVNLIKEITYYFSEQIAKAKQHQIKDLIIDPGFGFSKTIDQNYELLNNLENLNLLEFPILVGVSRKSMIYKLLKKAPEDALNGTTCLNTIALIKGAKILRVHDVKEAKECITLTNQLNK
jgi:dihydropteroate synthase